MEVNLPVVVSCQKGMAQQRIPNMKGIMGARTKPLKVVDPVAVDSLTSIVSFETPPPKAGVKLIPADNPAELIRLLKRRSESYLVTIQKKKMPVLIFLDQSDNSIKRQHRKRFLTVRN